MIEQDARAAVLATAQEMSASGLSPGKSGNVSARAGKGEGSMVITPTGVAYAELTTQNLSFVGRDGALRISELKPSSEWHFHQAIYEARKDIDAIVHTHSEAATALACTGRGIPAFHYMVAAAGGKDIRCSPYALFGTEELASHAVAALEGRRACLLGNHGVIASGTTPGEALGLAQEVEALAAQYICVLSIGDGNILSDEEMELVLEKFSTYGQQD